jgi:hypothetical protein
LSSVYFAQPRPIAVAAGVKDAGMSVISYRQFINRDLPMGERGCTSKAVFLSRSEARSYTRRNRRNDGSTHPYHCRSCDWWHLGHRR